MTCEVCAYAAKHVWYGPGFVGSHCRYCHRNWKSKIQAHCVAHVGDGRCCEHFVSNGVANFHWGSGKSNKAPAYDAKHLDPHKVAALAQDDKGVWHLSAKRPGHLPQGHLEAIASDSESRSTPDTPTSLLEAP